LLGEAAHFSTAPQVGLIASKRWATNPTGTDGRLCIR